MYRKLATLLAVVAVLVGLGGPASAGPQGFIEDESGVGFFYGTFNQSPNIVLLAGGTVAEFCEFNPDGSPIDPGIAPSRVFPRGDGSVDIKVNDKGQPIHLYYTDFNDAPLWIGQVCSDLDNGAAAPAPFASGTADLKVRISVLSENVVDVFNSVNGKATGSDGTEYKVRAWADLMIENGIPVGNPEDFVGFRLTQIRR